MTTIDPTLIIDVLIVMTNQWTNTLIIDVLIVMTNQWTNTHYRCVNSNDNQWSNPHYRCVNSNDKPVNQHSL